MKLTAYDAEALVTAFYDAAAALDEKGVSQDGRVGILNPRQYYKLIQEVGENGLINRDEQGTARQRGNGIVEIAGIKIYKSMNIPFLGKFGTEFSASGVADPGNTGSFIGETMADDEAVTGDNYGSRNNYGAANKFAHSCGLIFQREAAGCVESIGPQVQVTSGDVNVMYQGDLMVGRLAMGSDYLNPLLVLNCWLALMALMLQKTLTAGDSFLILGILRDPFFYLLLLCLSPMLRPPNWMLSIKSLSSVGQAPVTTLDLQNPEVAIVLTTLREVNKQVQSEVGCLILNVSSR